MAYTLAIHKKGYETFNINGFSEIPSFENLNETSLKDIIFFTHQFESEEHLVETLLHYDLIPANYSNGSIEIRKYHKNRPKDMKALRYGVSYKGDEKYYDLDFLLRYYTGDIYDSYTQDILKELTTKFSGMFEGLSKNSNENKSKKFDKLRYILNNINYSINNINILSPSDYEYLIQQIRGFILKYCTHKNPKFEYDITFEHLRDLAMFTIDYERKNIRKKETNKFKESNYIEKLRNSISEKQMKLENETFSEEEYWLILAEINDLQQELDYLEQKSKSRTRSIDDDITEF